MRRKLSRIMAHLTAALLLAAPVSAETRQALVIADRATAQEPGQPARDALAVSRALLAAGFDVRRLENPSVLPSAPAEAPDIMLIYVSGEIAAENGQPRAMLSSGAIDLVALADSYPAKAQRIVLAETCPAVPSGEAASKALSVSVPPDMMLAAIPDAAACGDQARLTSVLLPALDQAGVELAAALGEAGLPVLTGAGWSGFQARHAQPQPASNSSSMIVEPQRPVRVTPQAAAPAASGGGVQILPASAPARPLTGDREARPTAAGLPEPSIIVGVRPRLETPDASGENLTGTAIGTSYEERRRIREDDPQLFASLLESGAFDPAPEKVASVIQEDLQRMNCYRSGVDGIWGDGSRRSVDRYFQQVGGSPVTREAEISLFRQIAARDDVRCPDPVVRQPVRSEPAATARRTPSRQPARQPARQPQQQQPARQPQQPAAPSQGLNPNALGTGIFR